MAIDKTKVRLRVVGVFYDKQFLFSEIEKASAKDNPTIKDLLDYAVQEGKTVKILSSGGALVQEINGFGYTAATRYKPVDPKTPNGRINSLLGFEHAFEAVIKPSLGDKTRDAGYYKLFESTSVEKGSVTVHAWQYYLIRKGVVESNYWSPENKASNPDVSPADPKLTGGDGGNGAGFTPFDIQPIQPGDEVVWRNVSIVRNPQTPPIY